MTIYSQNNKKKNAVKRVLLGLVLFGSATTAGVSLAKYVTKSTSKDDEVASVAKFGVTLTTGTGTVTSNSYNEGAIKGTGETKVVAPGASGSFFDFTVAESNREVKVKIVLEYTVTYSSDFNFSETWYTPISVKPGATGFSSSESTSDKDGSRTVTHKLEKVFAIGTSCAGTYGATWSWNFEGNDDEKDTALGQKSTAPTVTFNGSCSVTQVA